jgi:hypothetical protein
MFDSYEYVMDRNPLVVKRYKTAETGCVYLTRGSEFYGVTVIKYTDVENEFVRTRGRMDVNAAEEFYNVACRYIRGEISWTEPVREFGCKYNQKCSKLCAPENCPVVLGGADYHSIFSKSCMFRKVKTK